MTPSQKAIQYANDVVDGKIPNCKWVVLACKRMLRDLQQQGTDEFPFVFNESKADRVVEFIEMMPHVKGKWFKERRLIHLEPWQCFIICNEFGWVHRTTGLRRFSTCFKLIPRKNAKSTLESCVGIYMTGFDGEAGAEVYSGATTEKQAHEVFEPAWLMVNKQDDLREAKGIKQQGTEANPGSIYITESLSKFEVLVGNPGDGSNPHCAIVDEYHEHETNRMVDTMQTGMGSREQPMLRIVSTAGFNLGGPCYQMQQEMQAILEGIVKDETTFCVMYGIDPEDRWDDPASIRKANPNLGVSVNEDRLLAQLEQAKRSSNMQNTYRTKYLNEWVGAKTAWMNMVPWMKQAAWLGQDGNIYPFEEATLKKIPGRLITMDDFKDCPARMAVDLSSRKDTTAVNVTFKKDGRYYSFQKFFAPEAAAEENEKYREFELSGHLVLTDGSMMDQEVVMEYIIETAQKYKILDASFDEWNADAMMTTLQKKKLNVIKFPFRTQYVSLPMKTLEALVLDGRYFHDNNPMMNWMVTNVAAKVNIKGDVYPNKSRPHDEKCKIDGVVTSIMSIGRWMTEEEPKKLQVHIF